MTRGARDALGGGVNPAVAGARLERSRGSEGKFVRDLEHAERDGKACLMVAQGYTYAEVARALGFADKGAAWRAVQGALMETASASGAAVLREQQLVGLAELKKKMWAIVNAPLGMVDRLGRPVTDPDGEPVPDPHAQVEAASVIIRAEDRISKLRGLDAAKKSVSASVSAHEGMSFAEIDTLIGVLQGALEARAAEAEADAANVAAIASAGRPPGEGRTAVGMIRAIAEVVDRQADEVLAEAKVTLPGAVEE
jgi:hypothetical protein